MSPNEDKNSPRQARLAQKQIVSTRLSETTRFIAFGIVAWVFAVQSSDAAFSKSYVESYELWLNFAGVLGVVTIASDYFQYLCAYWSVQNALKRSTEDYKFNKNHPAYFFQNAFFGLKQISAGLGAAIVSVTFAIHVVLN